MYRTDFWSLWEKARVGCFERTASKHVYYLKWNRSPAQAGYMRQVLGPSALGRPRGIRWRGSWEGGSGWGTHVNPWLIHVNVWQNPLQHCKVISLQLIKINGKKRNKGNNWRLHIVYFSCWLKYSLYVNEVKLVNSCSNLLQVLKSSHKIFEFPSLNLSYVLFVFPSSIIAYKICWFWIPVSFCRISCFIILKCLFL